MEVDPKDLVTRMHFAYNEGASEPYELIESYVRQNPSRIDEMIKPKWARQRGTLLHWSCLYRCANTVKFLLSVNASVDIKFIDRNKILTYALHKKTACEIAASQNFKAIVSLFSTQKRKTEVATFLETLGLAQYEEAFEKYGVRQKEHIKMLVEVDWTNMSIAPFHKGIITDALHKETAPTELKPVVKPVNQNFTAKAVPFIEQHLKEIKNKELKRRKAHLVLLEEKFENKDADLFKLLEPEFNEVLNDPFDIQTYSDMWNTHLPKYFSGKASIIIEKHLAEIATKKAQKTREASFIFLEEQLENVKEDLQLLREIEPKLDFNDFEIKDYQTIFKQYLVQVHERGNRREPPTVRNQPGKRFSQIVPKAATDQLSVIDGLKKYATDNHLPLMVIQTLQDKIEDFTKTFIVPEKAFGMALCWLYTTESWVYTEVNKQLRDDSSTMELLAPYMKVLIESYKIFKGDKDEMTFYEGENEVYRRTKLTPKGLEYYKPDVNFVWSSFTSTSMEFSPYGDFGNVLFEITIPKKFKEAALCLENVSAFPQEREVLLLPNIAYKVTSVGSNTSKFSNTDHVIKVEIVGVFPLDPV